MATRKVRSRRQPSLPGFPDIPERPDIRIPRMQQWEQIDGDMDAAAHGGTIAHTVESGDAIELLKIQPVREYVGDGEAAEIGFPFWTREAYYYLDDLTSEENIRNVMSFIGMSRDDFEDLTPEQRALTMASALMDYGTGVDEGPAGWSYDLPDYEVKWSTGKTESLHDYLAEEDEEFKNDVLGYSDIRQKLEEQVQASADMGAAMAWSTIGDRLRDDAAREGYDPHTLVGVAEFGDAVAIDGDPTDKTDATVSMELEADDYEMIDLGGRIPTTEEHVDPDSIIRFVAKEMGVSKETVEDAAKGIDWWPKGRHAEIPWSTSGYASIWGKKDPHAHVEDGDYIIQPLWSDGTVIGGLGGGGGESFSMNDEEAAIQAAKKVLRDPTFEGDEVRVITRDGELVWSSKEEGTREARRAPRRRR